MIIRVRCLLRSPCLLNVSSGFQIVIYHPTPKLRSDRQVSGGTLRRKDHYWRGAILITLDLPSYCPTSVCFTSYLDKFVIKYSYFLTFILLRCCFVLFCFKLMGQTVYHECCHLCQYSRNHLTNLTPWEYFGVCFTLYLFGGDDSLVDDVCKNRWRLEKRTGSTLIHVIRRPYDCIKGTFYVCLRSFLDLRLKMSQSRSSTHGNTISNTITKPLISILNYK